jgi:hypothetical protein
LLVPFLLLLLYEITYPDEKRQKTTAALQEGEGENERETICWNNIRTHVKEGLVCFAIMSERESVSYHLRYGAFSPAASGTDLLSSLLAKFPSFLASSVGFVRSSFSLALYIFDQI